MQKIFLPKQAEKIASELAKEEEKTETEIVSEALKAYKFDKNWQKIRAASKRVHEQIEGGMAGNS